MSILNEARAIEVEQPTAVEFVERPLEALYPDEANRWIRTVGIPMLAACICIGLAFGTRYSWFYAGAIAFGPGLGVLAIIYLAISSDTNGTSTHDALINPAAQQHESAPAAAAA